MEKLFQIFITSKFHCIGVIMWIDLLKIHDLL